MVASFYGVVSSESRVQSSDKLLEENRLVDLHIIRVVPRGSEFVQVLFDDYNHDRVDFEMVWFASSDPNATHPEAGMIAKCASMSWFPSYSWLDAHHLNLPGLSGQIMSSG
jgi:hypothetical protein